MEERINDQLINITQSEGQLTVSSREVAENFGKRHTHVLDAIKNLVTENSATKNMLIESEYENRGKMYPEYLLTRDGFSLLVMGFTGKKALEWKLKYIEAFNKMEEELKNSVFKLPKNYKEALISLVEAEEEKERLVEEVKVLKPKADYTEKILKSKGLVTVTQIAKDYGMSGRAFNNLLHTLKVQYKLRGQWLLYSKYQDKGYTHSETIEYIDSDENIGSKMITKWTQSGRLFVYELLKKRGILPKIERN